MYYFFIKETGNDFIKEEFPNGETNYRDKYEIDIFIKELNLGFEFNGLWWHSDNFKDKNYHLDKTIYFNERGIRIIHIWEDEWIHKNNILKSQIKNILKRTDNRIYSRKCYIKEVDYRTAKLFLNNNHIQGNVNSVLKLGLYHGDILVSIMTFDHFEGRKKMNNNEWNLNRFCNILNHNIIGSASKLLNFFIKNYKPERIISYADRTWSSGDLYEKLEFKRVFESRPDYKYLINGIRVHKSRYKKNESLMNKFNKVWDCGKIKFERFF